MKPLDTDIYQAFMKGHSVGALAKQYKLDKSQIMKVINRVGNESRVTKSEVLYELHANEARSGRDI